MDNLPDEQKAFIAPYLTPEFAEIMKVFLGEEIGRYFQEISNPDIVLVPLRRNDVQSELEAIRAEEQYNSMNSQQSVGAPQQGLPAQQPTPQMVG
jgi:hypothetical protein